MTAFDKTLFLRRTLWLDAAVSGATGVAMWLGADLLQSWLGMPAALFQAAGLSLVPFCALLVVLATRAVVVRGAILAVIVANALWVAASLALLMSGAVAPTLLGYAFVIGQAVAVLGFAELQWVGLRRIGGTMAAA